MVVDGEQVAIIRELLRLTMRFLQPDSDLYKVIEYRLRSCKAPEFNVNTVAERFGINVDDPLRLSANDSPDPTTSPHPAVQSHLSCICSHSVAVHVAEKGRRGCTFNFGASTCACDEFKAKLPDQPFK